MYLEKLDEVLCFVDDLDINNNSEYKKAFQNLNSERFLLRFSYLLPKICFLRQTQQKPNRKVCIPVENKLVATRSIFYSFIDIYASFSFGIV